jgi:dipeptidyl aminopeptidase/acylaminoacyl peptidase
MKRLLLVVLVFTLYVPFAAPQPNAAAQTKARLLDKETFMDMESVSNPEISPDGTQIVFTRTWVDKVKDQYRSNLWIVDVAGTRVRELTSGSYSDSAPVWSPDGKRIAFLSDRDGTTQLHVLWLDTKEVAQLTHLERAPGNVKWSPDGKWLAFTAFVPDNEPILSIRLPERPRGAQWAAPAVVVDRLSWASDGRGPLPKGHTHVFTLDATLGGTPRQITSGKYNHNAFDWATDGKSLIVSGLRKPEAEYLRNDSELYAVDLATLEIKPLTDRQGPDGNPVVSPDGKLIAYVGYDDKQYTSHVSSVYLMNSDGSGKRLLAGTLDSSPQNLGWWSNNQTLYFTVESKGKTELCWVTLTDGKLNKASTGTHFSALSAAPKTGQMAIITSSLTEPGTLATFSLNQRQGEALKLNKLVDVNADVLSGVKLGPWEELWYTSKDGLKVQGWLVKPANFEPGKKYPMVLWIHGGPWSMYSTGWNWAFQNWAALGYAVLFTNPRGSTGYGQDFVNGIQYSYPGKDYDDLMAGVDAALAKGFIDDRNLFVCGGSGGGVLTAWIVGHTDRFAAAVSMRPVINWHSFVGTTDGASWYYQFQKRPWEDAQEFFVRSPLSYVANVKTPTMVMTGEADLRTPMSQSEEYYRALKMLKKETLLVRMPDEYHGWRRPSHQLAQQLYLLAWFEKHARKEQAAGR